eukprot:1976006-Pleurochrysis_carterae.AAC.1
MVDRCRQMCRELHFEQPCDASLGMQRAFGSTRARCTSGTKPDSSQVMRRSMKSTPVNPKFAVPHNIYLSWLHCCLSSVAWCYNTKINAQAMACNELFMPQLASWPA